MMKKMQISAIVTGLVILLATAGVSGAARLCNDDVARLVSRAYFLSFPLLGQDKVLEQMINANAAAFTADGAATRCMQDLGSALVQHSLVQGPGENPHAAQDEWGGQMPEGLEHLPGEVDASMRSASTEYFTMGQELLWLSRVLPQALQGDAGPYNAQDTQWRQIMAQVAPQLQLLCSMDASICETFLQSMSALGPMVEQQIFQLATAP